MTKALAAFLFGLVRLLTAPLGRWRRLTVLARLHDRLAPVAECDVRGLGVRFLTPDRTAVYWPRHGYASEPGTLDWLDGLGPGDVLYDIGANVGAYTVYAAKKTGARVVAFEPSPASFHVLVRNLALNGVAGQVTPLCLALADTTGPAAIGLGDLNAGSVGHGLGADTAFTLNTLSLRLDDAVGLLGLPAPSHVKLDVDGLEPPILAGAAAVLAGPALRAVLVEYRPHGAEARARIDELLTAAGLRLAAEAEDNRIYVRSESN
ncbi:MAG: FkbM family methyltransferase [Hyphomicrobiales bacterium]|nr:FkbM family methyltransferase [Hyphomicrobiales bacterium]MCP5372083.1 FkbM family methyltransferase [Hyphomicrobiales bacterium]